MRIEAEITLKSPCQCRAWIEDRLPWEVPTKDKRAIEYWEHCRHVVEKGFETPEKYLQPFLFWEKTGPGKKLPGDIHRRVYELTDGSLVPFWEEFGPLVQGNGIATSQIMNTLAFFRLIVDLWGSIVRGEESRVRGLLLSGLTFPEIEDFITDLLGESREYYCLYLKNGKPVLTSDYGHYVYDMGFYFLKLPAPIPQAEPGLVNYAKRVVRANLKRYLNSLRNFTDLDLLTHRLTIVPPDVMTAALFNLWEATGKETFDRVKYQRERREKGETVKDEVLAKYRVWKSREKITQEDYDKLKGYADRVYHEGMGKEEFRRKLEVYYKKYVKKLEITTSS